MKKLLTILGTVILAVTACFADESKLADDLLQATHGQSGRPHTVIVQTYDQPSQGHLRRADYAFSAFNGYVAKLSARDIVALSDDPEVKRISPDREVSGFMDVA